MTSSKRALGAGLLVAAALVAGSGTATAQVVIPPTVNVEYAYDTGWVANNGDTTEVVVSFPVLVHGSDWLRLYFDEVHLGGDLLAGTGAILRVTSWEDGAVQELDARHCRQWQNSSAYFNGDAVQVEIVAHPGTSPSRLVLRDVDCGVPGMPESQCGPTDDRVLSYDVRAGRQMPTGCTGWIIDDCAKCMLTAGHCAGSGLQVIEFNVPLSSSSGSLNHPPPSDQYSVDTASLQGNGGQGVGDDWAYYGTFPNSTTGLTAFQAQGAAFTLTNPPPVSGNDIRITGFGTDDTPPSHNQVQQTHVGPMVTSSGSLVQYQTDTTGGNSGSPVIWEQTGLAVGIHTHGGCSATAGNSGTGINHSGLQNALANPTGVCLAGTTITSSPPAALVPGVATPVSIVVSGNPVAGSVQLHYRYQGGTYTPIVMSPQGGGTYAADLPPAACGDNPEFYFSLQDAQCGLVVDPSGAPTIVYTAIVGTLTTIFHDDFQTNQGWTAQNLGATTGDWERGVPVNDPSWAYDPISDYDGSGQCYLTENATGNTDVDGGAVRLTSPIIDMSGGGAQISYAYYLYLTDASGIDMILVEINSNGGAGSWIEIARHTTNGDTSWRTHAITAGDLQAAGVTLTANMQVRFTTNDNDPQSINESGLDAFDVSVVSCGGCPDPVNYCTAKLTSTLSLPAIGFAGTASIGINDFRVNISDMVPGKPAIVFRGDAINNLPFQGGFLCALPPLQRMPVKQLSGAGSAEWTIDISGMVSGDIDYYQGWGRDPADPTGFGTSLSDGLKVTYCD